MGNEAYILAMIQMIDVQITACEAQTAYLKAARAGWVARLPVVV